MAEYHTGITGEFELLTDEFQLSDRELVSKLASGDQRALAVLFRRFGRSVRQFLVRMRGASDSEVEDLMQMTFLELTGAAEAFEGRSHVKTWLLGIATNVVRHHMRRELKRRDCISRLERLPTSPPPLPDDVAEQRRLLRSLEQAMEQLSPELQQALWLCVGHQMPVKAAAGLLEVPVGTVTRRVCEARKRLARAISRERHLDAMVRALRTRWFG